MLFEIKSGRCLRVTFNRISSQRRSRSNVVEVDVDTEIYGGKKMCVNLNKVKLQCCAYWTGCHCCVCIILVFLFNQFKLLIWSTVFVIEVSVSSSYLQSVSRYIYYCQQWITWTFWPDGPSDCGTFVLLVCVVSPFTESNIAIWLMVELTCSPYHWIGATIGCHQYVESLPLTPAAAPWATFKQCNIVWNFTSEFENAQKIKSRTNTETFQRLWRQMQFGLNFFPRLYVRTAQYQRIELLPQTYIAHEGESKDASIERSQ